MPDEAPQRRSRRAHWWLLAVLAVWVTIMIARSPPVVDPLLCDVDVVPRPDTLVMLSASWCGYCRRARAYLHEHGIAHCEYDVELSAEGRRRFASQPVKVVPIIEVAGDTLVGFNRTEIEQTLIAHGLADFGD